MSDDQIKDFGGGVRVALRWCECGDPECGHDKPCGILWYHNTPAGEECLSSGGYVPLRGPGGWSLDSVEPLTMSPSLLCGRCNTHGFIRDGKWVTA